MELEETTITTPEEDDDSSEMQEQRDGKLKKTLGEMEKELVCEALRKTRGNKAKAARTLGITERMMGLRVAKYGINAREFRTRR